MSILHDTLIACVAQLQERGGVIHTEAEYWLRSLRKAREEHVAQQDRINLLEEKIEFLAERSGLVDTPTAPTGAPEGPVDAYADYDDPDL